MNIRTTRTTVTFVNSFKIGGFDEIFPPGTYDVDTDEELLDLPAQQVLTRLYHEDNPQLFEPQDVIYECGCSREKTGDAILKLTLEDAKALVEERGDIEIICQFCLRQYLFDVVDVEALFKSNTDGSGSLN